MNIQTTRYVFLGLLLIAGPRPQWCSASMLQVTLDTTLLKSSPAQPFYVEFQLNDGSGSSDGNNTAIVSNFAGGTPGATLSRTGGVIGFLNSQVTLTDSGFFNEFYQQFTPGNTLSFNVNLTNAIDPGPQPDQFSFAILACKAPPVEIPTTSPANALLAINIDAAQTVQTFSGNPNAQLACGGGNNTPGPGIALPAPVVTKAAAAPEPASVFGAALGIAAGVAWLLRHRQRRL